MKLNSRPKIKSEINNHHKDRYRAFSAAPKNILGEVAPSPYDTIDKKNKSDLINATGDFLFLNWAGSNFEQAETFFAHSIIFN